MVSLEKLFPPGKVILFVVYDLKPNSITKSLYDLIEVLLKQSYKIYLVTIAKGADDLVMPIQPQYLYSSPNILWKQIGKNQVDIPFQEMVHIAVAYDGIFSAWLLAYFKGANKKIAWLHSIYERGHTGFDDSSVHQVYEKIDQLICVSYGVKQSYQAKLESGDFEHKLQVRYLFLNRQRIQKMAQEKGMRKEGFTLVAVGRLSEEKGFRRLIKIHKKLVDGGYAHFLWIVGDGPLKMELEKEIECLNIQESCKLLGYTSNPYRIMNEADVIVSASYGEGLPLVIMEAMLLAKPIVATNVTGQQELLVKGLGMLVSNDEEGIFEGIRQIIDDRDLRVELSEKLKSIQAFSFEQTRR